MTEDDVLLCSKCKKPPRLYQRCGLWYIQCKGKCERLEMALSKKKVIENWNDLNKRVVKTIIRTRKKSKEIKNEMEGVGKGEAIYQFDANGHIVKTFLSARHLANVLEMPKNTIIGKFYHSVSGCVTIKGIVYYREPRKNAKDNTKTTSTTTRKRRPREIADR